VPSCGNKVCGDDGCGGGCGTCNDGLVCNGFACVQGDAEPEPVDTTPPVETTPAGRFEGGGGCDGAGGMALLGLAALVVPLLRRRNAASRSA